jgi:hypothetical protein
VIDFSSKVFTQTGSSYPIANLPYGKYQITYTIEDYSGNSITDIREIYIDAVEFSVSRAEVDIGGI